MKKYVYVRICLLIGALTSLSSANIVYAQKPLKYVPQSLKSTKVVPYVVKPKLPTTVHAQFVMPVMRPVLSVTQPNVTANVERAVSASVTPRKRIARLEANLHTLEEYMRMHNNRLPDSENNGEDLMGQVKVDIGYLRQLGYLRRIGLTDNPLIIRFNMLVWKDRQQKMGFYQNFLERQIQEHLARLENNLTRLEEYARRHHNKLPPHANYGPSLEGQVSYDMIFLSIHDVAIDSFQQRYRRLIEADRQQDGQERYKSATRIYQTRMYQLIQEFRQQEREQKLREWNEVISQDKAWQDEMQGDPIADLVEEGSKAAIMSEQQIEFPGTVTDEYIDYLLHFYNQLDPLGTGTVQSLK